MYPHANKSATKTDKNKKKPLLEIDLNIHMNEKSLKNIVMLKRNLKRLGLAYLRVLRRD